MTATILNGHALAHEMLATTHAAADAFAARAGRRPTLALVLTGDNAGALAYSARIEEFAGRAGIATTMRRVEQSATLDEILGTIAALNQDGAVDAILPLLPFGPHVPPLAIAQSIDPRKDADGLTPANAGRLALGLDALAPCTPQGAIKLAEFVVGPVAGLTVTIVGASLSVGRPLALMLLQREATVTIAHAATRDLAGACRTAELLFVAAGRAGLINASHVKPGAVVIDIGINMVEGPPPRLVGDVDVVSVAPVARAISAAPDGVGPLTTAFLMANVLRAAQTR
jgi:methylenetetrahydrofolate dehydrogenase (NADP+)/methenyltetrahydrofolate cyclohydrolase